MLTAAHCVNRHIKGVRLGEYDISSDYDGKPGTNRYESHRQVKLFIKKKKNYNNNSLLHIKPKENYKTL